MESKRSEIRSNKFKAIACGGIIMIILIIVIFTLHNFSSTSKQSDTRVIYSLDKMQNDQEIINVINGSQKYIYFAIYEFTKENIADSLIEAKDRGVIVKGITDRINSTDPYEKPIIEKLRSAGIDVETEKHQDGIMHIKAIVSEKAFASGSYNWTSSATVSNDEILEVGTDESLREQYETILKKIIETNTSVSGKNIPTDNNKDYSRIIDYKDAPNYIGKGVTIKGKIINIYRSAKGVTYFDYCSSYKNCPFSAVIFSEDISKFKDLSSYIGKTILVSGTIKPYNNKAEMILNSEDQIKLDN